MKTSTMIYKFCKKTNQTRTDLARKLGISAGYLSGISNGKGDFSEKLMAKFVDLYKKEIINPVPVLTKIEAPVPVQAPVVSPITFRDQLIHIARSNDRLLSTLTKIANALGIEVK